MEISEEKLKSTRLRFLNDREGAEAPTSAKYKLHRTRMDVKVWCLLVLPNHYTLAITLKI